MPGQAKGGRASRGRDTVALSPFLKPCLRVPTHWLCTHGSGSWGGVQAAQGGLGAPAPEARSEAPYRRGSYEKLEAGNTGQADKSQYGCLEEIQIREERRPEMTEDRAGNWDRQHVPQFSWGCSHPSLLRKPGGNRSRSSLSINWSLLLPIPSHHTL